jgi:hypothetical protein
MDPPMHQDGGFKRDIAIGAHMLEQHPLWFATKDKFGEELTLNRSVGGVLIELHDPRTGEKLDIEISRDTAEALGTWLISRRSV